MKNKYDGKCINCGGIVTAGTGTVEKINERWVVKHDQCPEITSGLGIGGVGSDDYTINSDLVHPEKQDSKPAGSQVAPSGSTYGYSTPGARCQTCGLPANYNPNAGMHLCSRHWDEY